MSPIDPGREADATLAVVRVLIADDNALVRRGLRHLLAVPGDLALVGVAADGAEAVALCADVEPDVVLMDLSMPVLDGVEATRRIHAERPRAVVLMLTVWSDRDRLAEAEAAGAVGTLLKDDDPRRLLDAVRLAARRAPLAA
jgi:DNA-binding NarL/FixJ family response regulator